MDADGSLQRLVGTLTRRNQRLTALVHDLRLEIQHMKRQLAEAGKRRLK